VAQIQVAIMIHQAEAHPIEPSGFPQDVARHCGIISKVNGRLDFYAKHSQRNSVRVCEKGARHRGNLRGDTLLDSDSDRFSVQSLENTERCPGVYAGKKAGFPVGIS
jgi:hypothetical protein